MLTDTSLLQTIDCINKTDKLQTDTHRKHPASCAE